MASQAEITAVRVARNGATALLASLGRKAVARASFGKWFSEDVNFMTRSELDTALRCRDLKKIRGFFLACDQEEEIRNAVRKMQGYPEIASNQFDEVLLKVVMIYSDNDKSANAFAIKALEKLKSMRNYIAIAELVETSGTPERKRSCLGFLEDNLLFLIDNGWDGPLRTIRKHTKLDAFKDRIDRVLSIDCGIRRGLKILVDGGDYRKIVDLLSDKQLSGCAEYVLDLLERNIDKVTATGDEVVMHFVLQSTQKDAIRKKVQSKVRRESSAQEA